MFWREGECERPTGCLASQSLVCLEMWAE
jgi:hypothetical protein